MSQNPTNPAPSNGTAPPSAKPGDDIPQPGKAAAAGLTELVRATTDDFVSRSTSFLSRVTSEEARSDMTRTLARLTELRASLLFANNADERARINQNLEHVYNTGYNIFAEHAANLAREANALWASFMERLSETLTRLAGVAIPAFLG